MVNQTNAGISARITIPLDHSHTAGSQSANFRPTRRMSITEVMLLATPLMRVNTTQKAISIDARQRQNHAGPAVVREGCGETAAVSVSDVTCAF